MNQVFSIGGVVVVACAMLFIVGCSTNGIPMRVSPGAGVPKSKSWYVEGKTSNGAPVSCSFVEFDERGDFLDFQQHKACEKVIEGLSKSSNLLVVIYCHGWKNNSQSGDVVEFNAFLGKLAASEEMQSHNLRVHGVYLGWRGNSFEPFIERNDPESCYQKCMELFGEPLVDKRYQRSLYWTGALPETLSYWNRKGAAEHRVSGLPMARAIFTYASAGKGYGKQLNNRVCVIGHSFGALMLERSLGQGMTGELTMEWWNNPQRENAIEKPGLPFDLVLFVNSAAPAIYAKEMRDFLMAHRSALGRWHNPAQDAPVIVSITSTADWATGVVHPIGNAFAPLSPSLKRRYTTGIFGLPKNGLYPEHKPIRQSEFYTRTPGHQPYLINHWIVEDKTALPTPEPSSDTVFCLNLSTNVADPDVFFTSKDKYPAAAWRISTKPAPPEKPVELDGMPLSMADSDYWIISCGKELIGGHNDVWSTTTMEMYAAIFRTVEARRLAKEHKLAAPK